MSAAGTREGGRQVGVPVIRLVTIGVYGFDVETFVQRLRSADVRLAARHPVTIEDLRPS